MSFHKLMDVLDDIFDGYHHNNIPPHMRPGYTLPNGQPYQPKPPEQPYPPYKQPMMPIIGYYQINSGDIGTGKVYFFQNNGDLNPINVLHKGFAKDFVDLGGGYGHDMWDVYYNGLKINHSGIASNFQVTDPNWGIARDGFGYIYVNGIRK